MVDSRFSTSLRSLFSRRATLALVAPALAVALALVSHAAAGGAIDTPTAAGGRIARGVVPARRGRKPKMWPLFDLPESGVVPGSRKCRAMGTNSRQEENFWARVLRKRPLAALSDPARAGVLRKRGAAAQAVPVVLHFLQPGKWQMVLVVVVRVTIFKRGGLLFV